MSRGLPAPPVTDGTRAVNRGRLDLTRCPSHAEGEDGSTVIEMRESAATDARQEPARAADGGVLISMWQDFEDWQFELNRHRPAAPDEIAWEPIA